MTPGLQIERYFLGGNRVVLCISGGRSVGFVGTLKEERSQVAKQIPIESTFSIPCIFCTPALFCFIYTHLAVCLLFLQDKLMFLLWLL